MNDNTLFQNMEILKEKFKISYKEAKEVLESHDNNLIESLIFIILFSTLNSFNFLQETHTTF